MYIIQDFSSLAIPDSNKSDLIEKGIYDKFLFQVII